jgi:hypothetical protein
MRHKRSGQDEAAHHSSGGRMVWHRAELSAANTTSQLYKSPICNYWINEALARGSSVAEASVTACRSSLMSYGLDTHGAPA